MILGLRGTDRWAIQMVTFHPYQETTPAVGVTGFRRCHNISTTNKLVFQSSKAREEVKMWQDLDHAWQKQGVNWNSPSKHKKDEDQPGLEWNNWPKNIKCFVWENTILSECPLRTRVVVKNCILYFLVPIEYWWLPELMGLSCMGPQWTLWNDSVDRGNGVGRWESLS